MNTCYYSLSEIVFFPERTTKTEVLYNALRLIEPELEDAVPILKNVPPESIRRIYDLVMLKGLYCLTIDNKVVSVAVIADNVIERIITLPPYRRKGYATILIKMLTGAMKGCGFTCVFSPVRSDIAPLFLKAGWVKCGTGAPDGTFDYCPKDDLPEYGKRTPIDPKKWLMHLLMKQKHIISRR
jgi:hypothetical protein